MALPLALSTAEADRTVADALGDAWWTPWLLLAAVAAIGLWMLPSLVKRRDRARRIRVAAASAGLRFQEQDGPGLARVRFSLLVPDGRCKWVATNVVTAEHGSTTVHVFDARAYVERDVESPDGRSKTVRRGRGSTVTGAIVTLPINAPRTLITHENLASKLFTTVARLDLDVESDLFNTKYHVIADDRRFARELLEARMIDLIVQSEGRMAFEFSGPRLFVRAPLLESGLIAGFARYVAQFPGAIGASVVQRWPDGAGIDRRHT